MSSLGDIMLQVGVVADESFGKLSGQIGTVMGGIGKTVGATMVGVGAVASTVGAGMVSLGEEFNRTVNSLGATTGAVGEELDELGVIAKNVYGNNFGGSMEEVGEALSIIKTQTALVGEELQKATEYGFALADTFGIGVEESTTTVNSLMKQFGISAEDAYNIIAYGAQNGANQNGDLVDVLNEYSTAYSDLGLTAEEFMLSLIAGSEEGIFSIDKVGDAVKEFGIRAKDGSDSTMQAFTDLGFSADEMGAKFAQGGEVGRDAMFEVLGALEGIEDPMLKNQTGVALLGSMYEDLGGDVLPVLLAMEDGADGVGESMGKINEVKYNDLTSAMEGVRRSLEVGLLPVASNVANGLTAFMGDIQGILSDGIMTLNDYMPEISSMIANVVTGLVGTAVEVLPSLLPLLLDGAVSVLQSVIDAIVANVDPLVGMVVNMLMNIVGFVLDNLPILLEATVAIIVAIAGGITDALPELIPAVIGALLAIVDTLLVNLDKVVGVAFEIIGALAEGVLDALPILMAELPKVIESIAVFMGSKMPDLVAMGVDIVVAIAVGIVQAIPQLVVELPRVVGAILTGVRETVKGIRIVGDEILVALVDGIEQAMPNLMALLSVVVGTILDGVRGAIEYIGSIGVDILEELGSGIVQAIPQLSSKLPRVADAVLEGVGEAVTDIRRIGVDIIEGLWQGISSMGSWLGNRVEGFFGGVVDGARDFLGIHSPSRVFAEIGSYMGEGIGVGFGETMQSVAKGMEQNIPTSFHTDIALKGVTSGIDVKPREGVDLPSVLQPESLGRGDGRSIVLEMHVENFLADAQYMQKFAKVLKKALDAENVRTGQVMLKV